jgi:4-hydroxy-4-methyl-2-oxoglutarate aldolase
MRIGQQGYPNQYVDGWQVLHPGKKLVGRAFTIQFMPARPDLAAAVAAKAKAQGLTNIKNQTVIDMLQPGDVAVVDLFGKKEQGTFVGDNLFHYIMVATRGAGLVVDGAVRDLEGISNMDMPQLQRLQFPVYSRGASPGTTVNHFCCTGVNVPVTCAGVKVNPKDLISADEDGVVVIPHDNATGILKKAQELDFSEHSMYPFIERFKSLKEAIAKFGRI